MVACVCARSASEPKARKNKPFKQTQNDLKIPLTVTVTGGLNLWEGHSFICHMAM